jgi:hypothetical protein
VSAPNLAREERVPLRDIAENAADLIELYGGRVTDSSDYELRFTLPQRRGSAASGAVESVLSWVEDTPGEGTVTVSAEEHVAPPTFQRVAILIVGVIGAILWLLWPFFPSIGPLAFLGAVAAFATYLLTLRTPTGSAADFLQKLARSQREIAMEMDQEP